MAPALIAIIHPRQRFQSAPDLDEGHHRIVINAGQNGEWRPLHQFHTGTRVMFDGKVKVAKRTRKKPIAVAEVTKSKVPATATITKSTASKKVVSNASADVAPVPANAVSKAPALKSPDPGSVGLEGSERPMVLQPLPR